ncbi:uncharacterized protein BDR25DRAFT_21921 [Lindgomyces ingoldianus]|uniref:Uncharacterized protein n=1 Tax=Lindgomyces ingoldianus TaxID=673940 RepID=A0ACB6QX63_9PLEO|nr:uncharacterized protein BDR25DRAFT_21921 [Lindgomyces ingoldianus]KAF2471634.1 hypothetical protein BDR25DRAFT_21921 [Lindgomyces ingoldianus]
MASQMEWSHDFCLSCDRQIAEGAYCSQACRLADLEKAGTNEPTTPSNLSSSASSSSSSQGFYLPPAVNFSALKTPSTSRGFDMGPSSPHQYYSTAYGSYFASTASQPAAATATSTATARQSQQRSLTPSSSRSSLASAASQSTSGISLQAASQLNGYVRSFDPVRDMKRRFTHY